MTTPNVAVLLSSYNGERYIEAQIESILLQQDVHVTLYVRDDGSTDSTVEILSQLSSRYSNIVFSAERNRGLVKSFFTLLSDADENFQYYAFADQDDIWLSDKLISGINALQSAASAMPVMYFSRTEYVDTMLQHLGYSPLYLQKNIGFGNALVQNIATGCTIVMNGAARKLIVTNLPEICLVHDWWVYLVISAFGSVIYDATPHIKYRQHGGNVIGVASSPLKGFIRRTRRYLSAMPKYRASEQIKEFHRIFKSELRPDQINDVMKALASDQGILGRIALVFQRFYWRQSFMDNVLLRLVILTGRF